MDKTRSYFCSPELSYGVSSNMTTPVDDSVDAQAMLGVYMYHSTVVMFSLYFYISISRIGKSWFYGLYFFSCGQTNWATKL